MARRGSDGGRLQAELERLHALPPPAFTAARNELAARLRQEGRRDDSAAVKALPRPTPSSWAVSRLMRLEPARFQALLAAGREARQAQRRVLAGRPAASAAPAARLRETLQSARSLIEELRRRGLELLAASGLPATAASADRLSADLQALAFTAGAESAIERGWLDHDLDAPGFDVLAGLQAAAGPAAARARPREAVAKQAPAAGAATEAPAKGSRGRPPRRPEESRQRQAGERHEREQARLQLARDRERARLANAEAEMERAAAESARLEAAAAAAEQAATEASRRAAEAQRDAEWAGRGAEQARRALDRARERLEAIRAAAEPDLEA